MEQSTKELISNIDALLARFPGVKHTWFSSTMGGGFSDTVGYESLVTEIVSLVTHIYGNGHPHTQRVIYAFNQASLKALEQMEGILEGTKSNLIKGLLVQLKSRVILDIKSDFLEVARELLDDGLKDPAAVLACTVLEDSLKRLAMMRGIGSAQGKEMSVVSSALFKQGVIEKSTNRAILSFKDLRNAAFHAQWEHVSEETVRMLLTFLPTFIEKHGI